MRLQLQQSATNDPYFNTAATRLNILLSNRITEILRWEAENSEWVDTLGPE